MISIPLIDQRTDIDCCARLYRRAIYNTLLKLSPRYSLEIGSHLFQTSSVFSRYYEEYNKDGCLVTCDIAKWSKSDPPNHVHQVMVYPHIPNIQDNHGGIDIYYKDWEKQTDISLYLNTEYIIDKMDDLNIDLFDLSFVDGDHATKSFILDLKIAKNLTSQNGYILIDDINDQNHEQYNVYRELKSKGNVFYEFDGWNPHPGMALIKNEDLNLHIPDWMIVK